MEGDAGAKRRLNPTDADDSFSSSEVTAEDLPGSEVGAEETGNEVTAEDLSGSEVGDSAEAEAGDFDESAEPVVGPRPSRMGLAWVAAVAVALILFTAGVGTGAYFLITAHHKSQETSRNNVLALKAAVDCVSATQAPDTNAMVASEQKIIDCGTDEFRSQALLYTSMLVQAYQASNIHVQVSDVRAAVERDNDDRSVIVLVALRVKVNNDQAQNETGYRLRVKMALQDGAYKIAKLDQVTKLDQGTK
jgi:Mce-associated membrane protein